MEVARIQERCKRGVEEYPVRESFDDFDLAEDLLRGIHAEGLEKPSDLQRRGIKPILHGRHAIGQARSGTGRTTTLVIGVLQRLDPSVQVCQGLILAPTRERAIQIQEVALALCKHRNVRCMACSGGGAVGEEIEKLKGQHLVVGAPGPVFHMIRMRHLRVDDLITFALLGADEMLSRGFKAQLYDILKTLRPNVQVCLFTATMPDEILDLTTRFMRGAVKILVEQEQVSLEGMRQFYLSVERLEWKLDTLCDVLEELTISQVLVYCNTRRQVDLISDHLTKLDFRVSTLHADLEQVEYDAVMREIRSGSSRTLVATDVLAPGMGMEFSVTINYDLPQHMETYLRRIGRSGKFGRKGLAINFVMSSADDRAITGIEKFYNTQINDLPMNFADLL